MVKKDVTVLRKKLFKQTQKFYFLNLEFGQAALPVMTLLYQKCLEKFYKRFP